MSILIYGGSGLCNVILLELVLLTARRELSFIIFIISILSPDTNPSLHLTARPAMARSTNMPLMKENKK